MALAERTSLIQRVWPMENVPVVSPKGIILEYGLILIVSLCDEVYHFKKSYSLYLIFGRYNSNTYFDDCGFPVYKRRNTGAKVKRKGHDLDNSFVVPYNRDL